MTAAVIPAVEIAAVPEAGVEASPAREEELELESAEDEAEEEDLSSWLAAELRKIVAECDLSTMTLGMVRATLEQKLGVEAGVLESQKEVVERLVREAVESRQDEAQGDNETPRKRHKKHRGEKRKAPKAERLERSEKKTNRKYLRTEGVSAPEHKRKVVQPSPRDVLAEHLPVTIAGKPIDLNALEFSSGRRGFFACQSLPLEVDGATYQIQCMVQCAVVRADRPDVETQETVAANGQVDGVVAESKPAAVAEVSGQSGDASTAPSPVDAAKTEATTSNVEPESP